MTHKNTMTTSQIQTFLNGKVPSCDTNGTKPASEFGRSDLTHAQYAKTQGWPAPPYTCLKNYSQGGKTSAQIIYNAAQQYSINPQVLIVLLQKEQGLIEDTWPLSSQYRSATGYGCPDNAPCDSDYYGLTNQVNWAAKMFRAILNDSPTWSTPYELGNNYIQYNPDKSCGGGTVNIQNRATQALYNYTPYQPNSGALSAGWGTAHCGSYGNRNFYLYFTSWFGGTRVKFTSMTSARWMQTKVDTYKKNPGTDQNVGDLIPAGTQIYFPQKATVGDKMYLQTRHDTRESLGYGIAYSDLEEIPVNYTSLQKPRWLMTTSSLKKENPITSQQVGGTIPAGTAIYFPSKMDIGDLTYLRTQHDADQGITAGVPLSKLKDATLNYTDFAQPRWMEARTNTSTLNLKSYDPTGDPITSGDQLYFDHKIIINNTTYATKGVPASGSYIGVPLSDLKDIPATYNTLLSARWMITTADIYKKNPITEEAVWSKIPAGTKIYFPTKIIIRGITYLRTQHDTDENINAGIPLSSLTEDYSPMTIPRSMVAKGTIYKRNPTTGEFTGDPIPSGTQLSFTSKVMVGDRLYLRTQNDTTNQINAGILYSDLEDDS